MWPAFVMTSTGLQAAVVLTRVAGTSTLHGLLQEADRGGPWVANPADIVSINRAGMGSIIRYRYCPDSYETRPVREETVAVQEPPDEVARCLRAAAAGSPEATDEVRLAAGWRQELRSVVAPVPSNAVPAPLPAGGWRYVGEGMNMRWVLPMEGDAPAVEDLQDLFNRACSDRDAAYTRVGELGVELDAARKKTDAWMKKHQETLQGLVGRQDHLVKIREALGCAHDLDILDAIRALQAKTLGS